MRKISFLLTILVIFSLTSAFCSAEENADKYISEFEEIIPEGVGEEIVDGDGLQKALGLDFLLSEIINSVKKEKSEISGFLLTLLGALVMLCASSFVSGELGGAVSASVGCVVTVLMFSSIYGMISNATSAINEANDFFVALIPIAVGVTSLGGGAFAAGVQTTGMTVTAAALAKLWGTGLTSVSGLGLSMALASSYGGRGTSEVSKWVKKTFSWLLGIATAAISGTLALQTMVASARDSAAMRAAKYAASGMIPVVGSTVSAALSTLASGVSYVKGIVGGGSVFAIISILISPLIVILIYRFSLSFVIMLTEFFEISAARRIFGAYLYSLDTVITTYTLSVMIYIFEIILFVKSGVALI